jgi:hypothetical protein
MAGGPGGLGKLPGARPDQYGPAGMPKATGINDYAEAPGTIGDIERYLRDKSQKRVGISDVTTPTEEADLVPELENPDKIGIGGKIALGASNILEGMLAGMQGRTPRNMDSISDVEQGRRDRRIRDIELDRELAERRKQREQSEERYAARIAAEIVRTRRETPIATTFALVAAIQRAVPKAYTHGRIHCATKTFQALRIAVNDEIQAIAQALEDLRPHMASGGRIAVISFHSIEDRVIKNTFRTWAKQGIATLDTKKPIPPSRDEIVRNPRARSAKLRVCSIT